MTSIKKYPTSKPEVLLERIHQAFPTLEWKEYSVNNNGWDHQVVILDNKIVFRFPNDDKYAASLRTEIEVLHKLGPLVKMRVPDYTYISPGCEFAGYPIIPGETINKVMFDALPVLDRLKIAKQLADILSILHTLMQKDHHFDNVPYSYMDQDQQDIKLFAGQYLGSVLTTQEQETVRDILQRVDVLLKSPLPAVLIHGDVYSQHLLWDKKSRNLGIIDFSDMARADPAIDFAELYEYGKEFVQQVYNHYKGPKDETFLQRSWLYQQWVGVYMMTDHFIYHKTTFEVARETFDRVMLGKM